MDLYRKAKFYSISKFTMVALSLLLAPQRESDPPYPSGRKDSEEGSLPRKDPWIRTLFQTITRP